MTWKKTLSAIVLSCATVVLAHDLKLVSEIRENNDEIDNISYFLSNYVIGTSDTFPYEFVNGQNTLKQQNQQLIGQTWLYKFL